MDIKDQISAVKGDIVTMNVDAIVNAANSSLLGGGGVDGAIHRAAGPGLLKECRSLGRCPTGQARITSGYNLPASYVIHTVGPVWTGGGRGEDGFLASCYRNVFEICSDHSDINSVAFPAISTGAYHFPLERAVCIALTETVRFCPVSQDKDPHTGNLKVLFVCFDNQTLDIYQRLIKALA